MLARPDPGVRGAGRHLHRVRVLLGLLGLVGRSRAAVRRDDHRAPLAHPDDLVVELASNDGYLLQHFLPHGIPGARDRSGEERCRGCDRPRRADARGVLRARARAPAGRGGSTAAARPRQQRPRAGSGHQRLRGRREGCSLPKAARRRSSFLTWRRSSSISSTTRSTTSTSPTSRSSRSARSSVRTGWSSSTSRRSQLMAGRCACSSATPRRAATYRPPSTALLEREDAAGLRDPETYRRFTAGVEMSKRALLELLIACTGRGEAGRRLRRARQGQHAAQLLRHPDRSSRVHGRPESVQAGEVHARDAHPDPCAGDGSPRRAPT